MFILYITPTQLSIQFFLLETVVIMISHSHPGFQTSRFKFTFENNFEVDNFTIEFKHSSFSIEYFALVHTTLHNIHPFLFLEG